MKTFTELYNKVLVEPDLVVILLQLHFSNRCLLASQKAPDSSRVDMTPLIRAVSLQMCKSLTYAVTLWSMQLHLLAQRKI